MADKTKTQQIAEKIREQRDARTRALDKLSKDTDDDAALLETLQQLQSAHIGYHEAIMSVPKAEKKKD